MSFRPASFRLIVAALAATIVFPSGSTARAESPQPIVIEIVKFRFEPQMVKLHPGDTVIWKTRDIVPHTATAKDGGWDSGTIEAGGSWKTVITEDMLGDYLCVFHPSMIASLNIRSE